MGVRLKAAAPKFEDIDFGDGVKINIRPATSVDHAAADASAGRRLRQAIEGQDALSEIGIDTANEDWTKDTDLLIGITRYLKAVELAQRVGRSWSGVTDDETGDDAQYNRVYIAALFREPVWLRRFEVIVFRELDFLKREGGRVRDYAEWVFGGGAAYCQNCKDMGSDCGQTCPMEKHKPETAEGLAAIKALSLPGVWLRSGIEGAVSGLDVEEAMERIEPDGLDMILVRQLLSFFEQGALVGMLFMASR